MWKETFKPVFVYGLFQVMTKQEREVITDMKKCNFNELAEHFKVKSEERKNMSKEEKQVCEMFHFQLFKTVYVLYECRIILLVSAFADQCYRRVISYWQNNQ